MKPTKEWLALWEQNRDKLKGSLALNDYFTLPEIAGRKLTVLPIGDCSIPTGQVLVCDPLVYLGLREEQPYFQCIPVGTWPTELCVITPENSMECARYAAARICFSAAPAVRFEEALIGNEDLSELEEDGYFGFGVDAGLGCFCDEAAHQAFCDFAQRWDKEHPNGNLYDDYFASLFAENYRCYPDHQRKDGDWLNWEMPDTSYHLPIFQSGFGDGIYPVYFGYDESGMICQIVTQLIDIQLSYGNPNDNISINDFDCDNGQCKGEISLDEWDEMFETESPYTLYFESDCDETLTSFNEVQKAGYDYVIQNQEEIAEAILAALLKEYSAMQADYGYNDEEREELMPDAADTDALAALLAPNSVIIHPVVRNGLPYIGYEFGCTWDEEHAFGAMLHGTSVVELGGADTAILTWIAEKDLEQQTMNT